MEEDISLKELFRNAESARAQLQLLSDQNEAGYQDKLSALIAQYEKCNSLIEHLSIFSRNEEIEDMATGSIPCPRQRFMQINFYIGELVNRTQSAERKAVVDRAATSLDDFLRLMQSYSLLSEADRKLYRRYKDNPLQFSTASTLDAVARRDTKIARYRQERETKQKLERLKTASQNIEVDDEIARDLYLTELRLNIGQALESLESLALEVQVLTHAPARDQPSIGANEQDQREQSRTQNNEYSDRLDQSRGSRKWAGQGGPILNKDGKPLQPFTLVGDRDRLRQGVFRPGHNLPTMSIDEYLEEERRRGGMIEGGGPESGLLAEPDEDNVEKADQEIMKAREWDEFVEANPKGSGNTINRG